MAGQMGKTTAIFSVFGQRLDDDPAPLLYVGPTKSNILSVIEPKIDEMLRSTPSLWTKTAKGKKYTKFRKIVAGVSLRMAWAGSPTELAADPAAFVAVDEVDKIERDIKGEGNVIELADGRHSSYPDGKTVATSTPTEGNVDTYTHAETGLEHWAHAEPEQVPSAIWILFQDGTAHEWAWPCPDCREYFVPRFRLLTFPSEAPLQEIRKAARLACPHCGSAIESRSKSWMNARGVFVAPGQRPLAHRDTDDGAHVADYTGAKAPVLKRKGRGVSRIDFGDFCLPAVQVGSPDVSFWVSGLANFSAKKTFGDLAVRWIRAVRSGQPERIKGCLNLQFGELFKFGGDAPEWHAVLACGAGYESGEVPAGVTLLIATVDVQKDRLVYVVRGWGAGEESWLIEAGELWGATDRPGTAEAPGPWEQLHELAEQEWGGLRIARGMIDSGYRKDNVYQFCRQHRATWFPTKGQDNPTRPFWSSPQDVNWQGKVIKAGVRLWNFDADLFKQWVHARVEWPSDQAGGWHVFDDVEAEYCKQIVGEQRIVLPSGRVTWKVVGANHYLDCEALQPLAVRSLGKGALEKIARKRAKRAEKPAAELEPKRARRKRRGSQFKVNKW